MPSSSSSQFSVRAAAAADAVRLACETLSLIRSVDADTRTKICAAYRRLVEDGVSPHQLFLTPVSSQEALVRLLDRYIAVAELAGEASREYRETFSALEPLAAAMESGEETAENAVLLSRMEDAMARYPKTCDGRMKSAFIQRVFMGEDAPVTAVSLRMNRDRYRGALQEVLADAGICDVPAAVPEFDTAALVYAPDLVTSGIWRMVPGRFAVVSLDAEVLAMPILVLPDEIAVFFHGDEVDPGTSIPLEFAGCGRGYAGSVSRGSRQSYLANPPAMLYLDRDLQQYARQTVEERKTGAVPSLVFLATGDPARYQVVCMQIAEDTAYAAAGPVSGAFADGFVLEPLDLLPAGVLNNWAWIPGRGAVLQIHASVAMPGSDHPIPPWLLGFFFTDDTFGISRPITLTYAGRLYGATLRVAGVFAFLQMHTGFLDLVRDRFAAAASAYHDLLISFEPSGADTYAVQFSSTAESLTTIRARNAFSDLVAHPNPATDADDSPSAPLTTDAGGRNAVYTDGFVIDDRQLAAATVKKDWALLATGEVVHVVYDNRVGDRVWAIPAWLASWFGHICDGDTLITLIYRRTAYYATLLAGAGGLYLGEEIGSIITDRSYRARDAGTHNLVVFEKTADDEYVLHFSERETTLAAGADDARKNRVRPYSAPVRRPVRISLDRDRVAQADSDLSETVRLLHIDYEDEDSAVPAPVVQPAAEGWDGFAAALTPVQTEVLRLLLADPVSSAALKAVAAREGRLLDSIYDAINETAVTATGDVLIEDGTVIDEYRDAVSAALGRIDV